MQNNRLSALLALSCLIFAFGLSACEKSGPENSGPQDYTSLQNKSTKRGVSFNFGQLPDNDIPLLGPALSWSYNWGAGTSAAAFEQFKTYGMDYCPMIWNANWHEETFRSFKRAHPECEYLLAYNEPNLTDQANMVPSVAAQDWPRLVALAKELGLKIIAPAMNYGTLENYHDPWKWLDEFFAQPGVSLNDVDGIAIHCYMGSAQAMKSYLDKFKKYGKPIWLTEFCNWANNNISLEAQMNYMVEAVNLLEADPDVFRYAWFIPRGNGENQCHNSLLQSQKPFGITDLGKVFVNMSTQDQSLYYKVGQVIPAEHYNSCTGNVHLKPCSDSKGVLELTDLKQRTGVTYQVELEKSAEYTLELRYMTYFESPLEFYLDGEHLGNIQLKNTDYKWDNYSLSISLPAGKHSIHLSGSTAFATSLNWLKLSKK